MNKWVIDTASNDRLGIRKQHPFQRSEISGVLLGPRNAAHVRGGECLGNRDSASSLPDPVGGKLNSSSQLGALPEKTIPLVRNA